MEIGPISGIRALPVVKTPPTDPRLSANFEIVHSEGPGDDTYSGSGRKAGRGQDDDEDETELGGEESQEESQDETREQSEESPRETAAYPDPAGRVDFFA